MLNSSPSIKAIWPYKELSAEALPLPPQPTRDKTPQRGIGLRASTAFPALVCEGAHIVHCHAIELSATGIVIERGRELSDREQRAPIKLELLLPHSPPVRVLARVVRRAEGTHYALRFVAISDVDRLTLMEHLDSEQAESLRLLDEIEQAGAAETPH